MLRFSLISFLRLLLMMNVIVCRVLLRNVCLCLFRCMICLHDKPGVSTHDLSGCSYVECNIHVMSSFISSVLFCFWRRGPLLLRRVPRGRTTLPKAVASKFRAHHRRVQSRLMLTPPSAMLGQATYIYIVVVLIVICLAAFFPFRGAPLLCVKVGRRFARLLANKRSRHFET